MRICFGVTSQLSSSSNSAGAPAACRGFTNVISKVSAPFIVPGPFQG